MKNENAQVYNNLFDFGVKLIKKRLELTVLTKVKALGFVLKTDNSLLSIL